MASSESIIFPTTNQNQTKPLLQVDYDYDYDYKARRISIKAGELLHLLQKTNEHWWKVQREQGGKPFFVPAQYVTELPASFSSSSRVLEVEEKDQEEGSGNRREQQQRHGEYEEKRKEGGEKSGLTKSSHSLLSLSKSSPTNSKGGETHETKIVKEKGESSKSKSKESFIFSFSKNKSNSKISRNDGSRASHREKNSKQECSKISATNAGKLKFFSSSLEELSRQIVFPGLTSESVADLTFRGDNRIHENSEPFGESVKEENDETSFSSPEERKPYSSFTSFHCDNRNQSQPQNYAHSNLHSINKCLTFRNPSFDKGSRRDTSQEKMERANHNAGGESEPFAFRNTTTAKSMESRVSPGVAGMNTKEPRNLPAIPTGSPVRKLADGWSEHFCESTNRYFYYNAKTKIRSWKPPRNSNSSSSNKKSEEHLGSSLSDGSANASSFEKSLENIPDLVGSPNVSFETELSSADKASTSSPHSDSNDNVTNTVLLKETYGENSRSSESVVGSTKDEENTELCGSSSTVIELPVPEGYEQKWDETRQQICYVNKITGSRWFASTDSQARVYYYEENTSNSSWFLPVPDVSPTQSQSPKEGNSSGVIQENTNLADKNPDLRVTGVKKRHSAGEVADRSLKSKSLLLSSDLRKQDLDKSYSLPRALRSIWTTGTLPPIIREGSLARSKITENGKKLRKNWGVVWVVLTESHLSIFRDHKYRLALKTEAEIELEGALVEWTEDKSSRKNVFQLSTLYDLQILFQEDNRESAQAWIDDIKSVSQSISGSNLDISMRLRSTESPENMLVGESKISSRLNRNKSTKLRITKVEEDKEWGSIKDHLKKFFSRRPPRESLVKKGIYKDESVFGSSLDKLCALEKDDVPKFVQQCILAIESKQENLKTDGIYRASGNLSQVQKIRLQVDQNNMTCLFQEEDVHVLAGCLKLFFRELKEPLIPSELFERALQACHASSKKEKVTQLKDIISALPKPNRCTLQALLKHLLKVAEYSEFNRMQIPNLAIVFGPTLMYAAQSQNMATELMQQNLVIEALLLEYSSVFQ